MLYFAYGSNMDPTQMRRRCPSHRFISIAKLEGYKLAFTRRSFRRRCGVADVIASPEHDVWGILYDIPSARDIERLDKAEGFKIGRKRGNAYDRNVLNIWSPVWPLKPILTHIYIAKKQAAPPPPSEHYLNLMITGARHWKLPEIYIKNLKSLREN